MRCLVTGGSGQVGLPLVRALVARGDHVVAIARSPGSERVLREAGAEVARCDLGPGGDLSDAMRGAELVFHLVGGMRGAGKIDADALNRATTQRMVEAIREHGRAVRAAVLASSCAVYGDRSGLWVEEDYPTSPDTAYGAAKVAAESAWLAGGFPGQVARLAAVYGQGCRFTMAEAIRAGRAWLPGEGRNVVPVVHVEDCARALLAIADRGAPGSIVHVAGRTQPTLRQFYDAVHRQVGGTPVRFWSTWVPSAIQVRLARRNERVQAALGRQPRLTPDALRLATAGVRLRVERLESDLGFSWTFGDHEEGLRAAFPAA